MDQSKMAFLQSVLKYSTSHVDQEQPPPLALEAGSASAPASSGGADAGSHTQQQAEAAAAGRQMSPERKKWLETALDSMSINPIEEMKKCMKYLDDEQAPIDKQIEALETLKDWCEDINFAVDFHKINGYNLLPKLLNRKSDDVRALTCELIGTCAQNNPYCQQTLIDSRMLQLMLFKLHKDVDDVKIKAMFAISCLTRDFEPGQRILLEGNAFDILVKAIQSPVEKLQIKCCFLFATICSNNKSIKEQLTNKNLIRTLVEMYRNPDSNIHEHLLSAISQLIDENPEALKQAKEMKDVNFKQILSTRIDTIREDPRFIEEKEMAEKIYSSLFQN